MEQPERERSGARPRRRWGERPSPHPPDPDRPGAKRSVLLLERLRAQRHLRHADQESAGARLLGDDPRATGARDQAGEPVGRSRRARDADSRVRDLYGAPEQHGDRTLSAESGSDQRLHDPGERQSSDPAELASVQARRDKRNEYARSAT